MARRRTSSKQAAGSQYENTCSYCLYFQPYPGADRPPQGNCTYHKEWIDNAARTTCKEMSAQRIEESGIYRLVLDKAHGWLYVRRPQKLRPRLFLLKGASGKRGDG